MFNIQVSGDVDPMDAPKHTAIRAIAQAAVDQLVALGDVTITASLADTPTGATTPMPKTVQPNPSEGEPA